MSDLTIIESPARGDGTACDGRVRRWREAAMEAAMEDLRDARGARAVLGHSVRNLIERLDPRVAALDQLLDEARELDLHFIPARYPNGLEAWTPAAGYGARQAANAIAGASAIVTAARQGLLD